MPQEVSLTRQKLTTPRAAAVAGILFSVLLIISLVLVRISIPGDPKQLGTWIGDSWRTVNLALNLLPFAGIAFLWFIGVVRDRLGEYEDRLFATVFLGSGLLFLAMLFSSAAVAGGMITMLGAISPTKLLESGVYLFGRAVTYEIMNVYAIKMSGVFMISTCTIAMRTGIFPRWMAFLGYALALLLILSIGLLPWISLVFPLWVLLISVYILLTNLRKPLDADRPLSESTLIGGKDK
jgi:hypothetical protein